MSTSRTPEPPFGRAAAGMRRERAGFSLIELLIALALGLCLALAVAPLWTSFQALGVTEADKTIWALQGRVAAARLERDLRAATAEGCPFPAGAPVLQATTSQVVLLVRKADSPAPILVEWELAGNSLMRRWGPCPLQRPLTFPHSLYTDSKTMLEGVRAVTSAFGYKAAGAALAAPVAEPDLLRVDGVSLLATSGMTDPGTGESMRAGARVGR